MTTRIDSVEPWWRRMWTAPVGPTFILGRGRPHARAEHIIAGSALPAELQRAIAAVVRRSRLWSGEQADVAFELVAHFTDALEAGRTAAEALGAFGDLTAAARLIRRAKKRNRSVLWFAWIRTWQAIALTIAATLLLYGGLVLRYYTASPTISRNYAAEFNSAIAAIPEQDRAWPLYRSAVLAMAVNPPNWGPGEIDWLSVYPGDDRWPEVAAYLDRIEPTLELTRRAAARPRLGMLLTTTEDRDLIAHRFKLWGQDYITGPREPEPDNPPLVYTLLPHVGEIRSLSANLIADTRRAAAAGDSQRILANLEAILAMADHVGESPFAISETVAIALFVRAANSLGETLARWPDTLNREQLVHLAHRFGTRTRTDLQVRLATERLIFIDLLQRMYTDDGNGNGRFTPEGLKQVLEFDPHALERYQSGLTSGTVGATSVRLTAPVVTATFASRRELVEEYDRLTALYLQHISRPMWAWSLRTPMEIADLYESAYLQDRFLPLRMLLPAFGVMAEQGERALQHRDAALTAIALELFRRETGEYPQSLEELSPRLLPETPRDRFDGQPLKYLLKDGRPILYSVGWDRIDDLGTPLPPEHIGPPLSQFVAPASATPTGADWILWPR